MNKKKLIIFLDSGDTLIDESTEVRDENDIVTTAKMVPGAREAIETLDKEGYTLVLVADGEVISFRNSLGQNGMYDHFSAYIISEMLKDRKPSPKMFKAAMGALDLDENDKKRIIMVGNNLARDVKGANNVGITSVFEDWSPRYSKIPKDDSEKPDYTIHKPTDLVALAAKLEAKLEREE